MGAIIKDLTMKHDQSFYITRMIIVSLVCMIGLAACSKNHKTVSTATRIITVQSTTPTQTMYYNGIIQALSLLPITSTVNGTIQSKNFRYGDTIKKGQLLISIDSAAAKATFQTALTGYLQAKSQEMTSRATAESDALLYKQGVISRNEYENAKSTHYFNHLAILQAGATLTQLNYDTSNILNLSLDNIESVQRAFNLTKGTQYLKIYSPQDGIALFANSSSSDSDQKVHVGDSVKQDQVLLNIGNLSGTSLTIKIDEINVNNIEKGQSATVTGSAFPSVTLKGIISAVDTQASSGNNNPEFDAEVVVSNLTADDLKTIRVGMSATVAVAIEQPPQIMVPIDAVTLINGKYYVTQVNSTGKRIQTEVTTGSTKATSVAIISGLNVGDKIVVPHSTT